MPSLSNPTQVVVGTGHTCAVDDNGITCWGRNAEGETSVPSMAFHADSDGDGVVDESDAFPNNASETQDSDGAG